MKASFRGVQYRIKVKKLKGDVGGYATDPTGRRPTIAIDPDSLCLEVLIHEALHACYWDLDENAIAEAGRDIARFLKKVGVRIQRETQ